MILAYIDYGPYFEEHLSKTWSLLSNSILFVCSFLYTGIIFEKPEGSLRSSAQEIVSECQSVNLRFGHLQKARFVLAYRDSKIKDTVSSLN